MEKQTQQYSSNTKRIAKNTLMLYFRQILIMLVSLYTVRVVLNTLGAEDYGIYNVVAGVVTMFSFLSGGMAAASQRYFSFDLGKGNFEQLKKTFSMSLTIYFMLAVIIVFLAETLGLWFVCNKLILPTERLFAAKIIYQTSILSFVLTMLTTPFMACIIAHEDMNIYAYVSIIEACLKLGIVFLLPLFSADKLIFYGILMTLVTFINTGVYRTVCHKKYSECKWKFYWNKPFFKELVSYTGWNMFGSAVGVFKNQIINILLNQFFNPVVIAARGVAAQVNSAVNSFSQGFSTAVRPQIIKSYAAKKYDKMQSLLFKSCKGTFLLMYLFTLPLCLEIDYVLKLWLTEPPKFVVLFTQLALIDALIDSISYPIMTAAQATGKIKVYQSVVGGILLLNLPISYIVLKIGFPPYSVFIVAISITFIAFFVRAFILKSLMTFSIRKFLFNVAIPLLVSSIVAFIIPYFITKILNASFIRLICTVAICVLCSILSFAFIAFTKNERLWAIKILKSKMGRKQND